jgi:hypothetical protein
MTYPLRIMPDKEPKRRDRLAREGEPSQRTEQGVEIPVPEREEVLDALRKAVRKLPAPNVKNADAIKRPSGPPLRGKRRSSRGQ